MPEPRWLACVRARLHPEWRAILARAWSVRFMLAAAMLDAVGGGCSFFTDAPEQYRAPLALLAGGATVLAAVARVMPQSNLASDA